MTRGIALASEGQDRLRPVPDRTDAMKDVRFEVQIVGEHLARLLRVNVWPSVERRPAAAL